MRTLLGVLMLCGFGLVSWGSAQETDVEHPKELTNSIGMKLVLIPKGTFTMGSPADEVGRREHETQHEVTISRDYYLGMYEVTQAQYEKVMGNNPSNFQGDNVANVDSSNHPVGRVSWDDAVEFCKRLSDSPEEKAAGRVYRLPTEAEWEYACRAGSKTAYSFVDAPDELGEYGWYGENSGGKTHAVGQKNPNAWGLYDMHGNVWEWCADWHGEYPKEPVTDPVGPAKGSDRVFRGGCWSYVAAGCMSSYRNWYDPANRNGFGGFRVTLSSQSGIP